MKFTKFNYDGNHEPITVDGFAIAAHVERDDDMGPPWEEHDGHGPVSEWTRRPKKPGERILSEDSGSYRYYDFQEAMKIAQRDGWDAPPYGGSKRQKARRAVESDFKHLKAWCDDEWNWVGVVLSVSRNGIELDDHAASLWGIESDAGEYLVEVANEILDEAVEAGRKALAAVNA